MKFSQLHYILSQNFGGTKYLCPPCRKFGVYVFPVIPINSVPGRCMLLSVLLFYVFVTRESPSVSPFWCFITQNSESGCSRNPLVPTTRISGDCYQTWPGSGTRGFAGFGIFKRLWQTRGLENMVQLWPIWSCVIRRFLCPKICH